MLVLPNHIKQHFQTENQSSCLCFIPKHFIHSSSKSMPRIEAFIDQVFADDGEDVRREIAHKLQDVGCF